MDFLIYLLPQTKDIYNLISQKVKIVENAPICKKFDIYGWYQSDTKIMTICTNKIQSGPDVKYYVNETILHESVHVAQSCKTKNGTLLPFNISLNYMNIVDHRKSDVNNSIKVNGEIIRNIEHEAFWMEDKPNEVKYVVKKYCL